MRIDDRSRYRSPTARTRVRRWHHLSRPTEPSEVAAGASAAGVRVPVGDRRILHRLGLLATFHSPGGERDRGRVRPRQDPRDVNDPATAELLCPQDYPFATKRLCVDTATSRPTTATTSRSSSVKASPIERITRAGTAHAGAEYAFDTLVFATGFDAMTGALIAIDIRGRAAPH